MNIRRIIIFDFCKTLVSFETADAFVAFCIRNTSVLKFIYIHILSIMLRLANKVLYISKHPYQINKKEWLLENLSGIPEAKVEQLAEQFLIGQVLPNRIDETMQRLDQHVGKNDLVFIISAGYDVYLKLFAKQYNVRVICSKIEFKDQICTGRLINPDCIGEQKLRALNNAIKLSEYNLDESIFYSDSYVDKPLFDAVGFPVAVLNEKHKEQVPKWATQPHFQILWWKNA